MNLDDLRRLGQTPAPPNAFASSLAASSVAKATARLARLRMFSVVGVAAAVAATGLGMSIFTTRSADVSDPPLSSSAPAGAPSESAEPVAPRSEPIAPSSPDVSSLPSHSPSGNQSMVPSQIPTQTATPRSNPSQDSPDSELIVIINPDGVGTQTDIPNASPASSEERAQPDAEETPKPSHTPPAHSTPEPDPPAPSVTDSPASPEPSPSESQEPGGPVAPAPTPTPNAPTPSSSASASTPPVRTPPIAGCKVSDMGTEYLEDQLAAGQNGDVATLSVLLINKGEAPCWIRGRTVTTFRERDGQESDGAPTEVNSMIQPGRGLKASVTYSVCDPSAKGATVTLKIGQYGPYRWRDTYGRGC